MGYMDAYNLRLNKSGGSIRQSNINTTRKYYEYNFRDDPTYYKVPMNGIETEMRIYDKNTDVVGYGHKYIQLMSNELPPLGGYIYWNQRCWMITATDESNEVNVTGTIRECNYPLRWLNDNLEEVERWAIFHDSTKYSSGESANASLVLGNTRYELFLPKDEETVKISRDKRFIIDDYDHAQIVDPTVFKVTKTNFVESTRLGDAIFILIMQENSFNPATDNREKMIADFKKNDYSLELVTPNNIQLEAENTLQIQVMAKVNGTETVDDIVYESSDEAIATVTTDGLITGIALSSCQIKVTFHSEIVVLDVEVVSTPVVDMGSCKINGSTELRIGGAAKTYNAVFYDSSGNSYDDVAVWNVYESDMTTVPTYITMSNITATSVQLKCSNDYKLDGKMIYLKLANIGGTCEEILPISLISLI